MTCKLLVAAMLPLLITVAEATEFSSQPVSSAIVSSGYRTFPGRNERDCVMKCEFLGNLLCSAASFVKETGLCLLSALRNASFGAAGGGGQVFRRQTGGLDFEPYFIGDRVFYLIQQRVKGNLSFARNWTEYENGFGDGSDFWIGLKSILELTGNSPRLLRVEAVTWSDVLSVCEYSDFIVGNASTNYTMTFGSYLSGSSNTSEDSLAYHKGMKFSTIDRDNDAYGGSCSHSYGKGGWWFKNCFRANPNALYHYSAVTDSTVMAWWGATPGTDIALKSIRLMLQLA